MADDSHAPGRPGSSLLVLGLVLVAAGGVARGDRIALRGGGQIRGKVVADPATPTACSS